MELTNQINECLAGTTAEVSDAQDRIVAFMVEQRDKAEDSDAWFHPAYSLLVEHEKLSNDLDDVVESI